MNRYQVSGDCRRFDDRIPDVGFRRSENHEGWRIEKNEVCNKQRWVSGNREPFDRNSRGMHSIYITGFPVKATWLWIRNMFREFGTVLDVFVASKRTKIGDRFAFVRYGSWEMASKAVMNLNGRYVAGRFLLVNHAKGGGRRSFWRKKVIVSMDDRHEATKIDVADNELCKVRKSCHLQLDHDKIQILENCYVGTTLRCCTAEYILDRLRAMNLHDIWLSRIASKSFVIGFFNDDVRRAMLRDNWCCLNEWFSEVKSWRADLVMGEQIARLRIQGLPLVAWNTENIGKIASLWGDLVSEECLVNVPDDARFCTIHVSTSTMTWINEEIDLKFGEYSTVIHVFESSTEIVWRNALDRVADSTAAMDEILRWDKVDWCKRAKHLNDKAHGETVGMADSSASQRTSGDTPVTGVEAEVAISNPLITGVTTKNLQIQNGLVNDISNNPEICEAKNLQIQIGLDNDKGKNPNTCGDNNYTAKFKEIFNGAENQDVSDSNDISRVSATCYSKPAEESGPFPDLVVTDSNFGGFALDSKRDSDQGTADNGGLSTAPSEGDSVEIYSERSTSSGDGDVPTEHVLNVLTTEELDTLRVGGNIQSDGRAAGKQSTVRRRKLKPLLDIYGGLWGNRLSQTTTVSKSKKKKLRKKATKNEVGDSGSNSLQEGSERTTDSDLRSCYTNLTRREEAKLILEVGRLAGFDTSGREEEALNSIMRIQEGSPH